MGAPRDIAYDAFPRIQFSLIGSYFCLLGDLPRILFRFHLYAIRGVIQDRGNEEEAEAEAEEEAEEEEEEGTCRFSGRGIT